MSQYSNPSKYENKLSSLQWWKVVTKHDGQLSRILYSIISGGKQENCLLVTK